MNSDIDTLLELFMFKTEILLKQNQENLQTKTSKGVNYIRPYM